ncbi:MAG: peptidyl-prolyl cis-trans isomerase [Phycisphaeraceae bacterium]
MALRINETLVTDEEIYREMDQLKNAARQRGESVNCCERDDEFRGFARDNMIARSLLTQEGERRGVIVSESEVLEAFDKIVQEAGGKEHFYINYSTSEEEEPAFRESIAVNIRLQRVLEAAVGEKTEPTDAEVEAHYKEHIDRYMTPEAIRVSHILKGLDHGADPRAAYAELMDLRARLKAGESFAELADAHSDKPGDGGDLGFFSRGELVEEFEAVVFSMDEGELSPIFLSPFGYHIAKMTGRKPSTPRPLEEIREEVRKLLREERHQDKMRAFIETLKSDAVVEEFEEQSPAPAHSHESSDTDERTIDDDATT